MASGVWKKCLRRVVMSIYEIDVCRQGQQLACAGGFAAQRWGNDMRLAMAQMAMTDNIDENADRALAYYDQAGEAGADLLFFPEIQFSPFFPQYENRDASRYLMDLTDRHVAALQNKALQHGMYVSPNLYLKAQDGHNYDASLWINEQGHISGISTMVHILQAERFYECDYYVPSQDGFHVFETPFGKIGIVICFDRHMPESIRTCALRGADLVIIPTANISAEPLEMFLWEIRVQVMQNQVAIAMCNRVGKEGDVAFAGQSVVVDPYGNVVSETDDHEQLIITDIDLTQTAAARKQRPFLKLRRPEWYA